VISVDPPPHGARQIGGSPLKCDACGEQYRQNVPRWNEKRGYEIGPTHLCRACYEDMHQNMWDCFAEERIAMLYVLWKHHEREHGKES